MLARFFIPTAKTLLSVYPGPRLRKNGRGLSNMWARLKIFCVHYARVLIFCPPQSKTSSYAHAALISQPFIHVVSVTTIFLHEW